MGAGIAVFSGGGGGGGRQPVVLRLFYGTDWKWLEEGASEVLPTYCNAVLRGQRQSPDPATWSVQGCSPIGHLVRRGISGSM